MVAVPLSQGRFWFYFNVGWYFVNINKVWPEPASQNVKDHFFCLFESTLECFLSTFNIAGSTDVAIVVAQWLHIATGYLFVEVKPLPCAFPSFCDLTGSLQYSSPPPFALTGVAL